MKNNLLRVGNYQKDMVGEVTPLGPIYGNGLFSYCVNDVFSMVTAGNSPLMNWIPSRGVDHLNATVAHLTWAGVPKGFDGSQTYGQYLADMDDIGDCDYGPSGAQFNVCEYSIPLFRVPFKSDTLSVLHFGAKYCESDPRYVIRGPLQGLQIDTDANWALSQVGFQMNEHMNWSQIYGDPASYKKTWFGLDAVIDTGFVQARQTGEGSCDYVDPMVINGNAFEDAGAFLLDLQARVNIVRNRALQRGVVLTSNDMAAVMSLSHWNWLADRIACGALELFCNPRIDVTNTVDGIERRRREVTSGGFGFGAIPFPDGFQLPVLIEPLMGAETTDVDGNPITVGDIYVLTRFYGNMNILEHLYLNWNQITYPRNPNEEIMQNGMVRTGWVEEANRCYYYYAESYNALVSKMQHLQIKYMDVVAQNTVAGENESTSYTSPNYYAYNGERGGNGTPLLVGFYGA